MTLAKFTFASYRVDTGRLGRLVICSGMRRRADKCICLCDTVTSPDPDPHPASEALPTLTGSKENENRKDLFPVHSVAVFALPAKPPGCPVPWQSVAVVSCMEGILELGSPKGTLIECEVFSCRSLKMDFVFNAFRTGTVRLETACNWE